MHIKTDSGSTCKYPLFLIQPRQRGEKYTKLILCVGNSLTAFAFDADYYFLSANLATAPQHKQLNN